MDAFRSSTSRRFYSLMSLALFSAPASKTPVTNTYYWSNQGKITNEFSLRKMLIEGPVPTPCTIVQHSFRLTFRKGRMKSDVTVDYISKHCPAFLGGGCPYAKLAQEKKGVCAKCPPFNNGCPFKQCKTVGELQDMMGQMRDQSKGEAQWIEFLKDVVFLSKEKHVEHRTQSLFKGGCPFAKDTAGKEILKPAYIECSYSLTVEEIVKKCPVFGKGVCPYTGLVAEMKGIAENCPGFKDGCPFKKLTTMGEYAGKLAEMRDKTTTPKGRAAFEKLIKRVHEISKEAEKKAGPWPFPPDTCPVFTRDAHGKRIMPKYN